MTTLTMTLEQAHAVARFPMKYALPVQQAALRLLARELDRRESHHAETERRRMLGGVW